MCDHPERYDDYTTGDSICIDCAKVLEPVYMHSAEPSRGTYFKPNSAMSSSNEKELIRNNLSFLMIESNTIVEDCLSILNAVRKRVQNEEHGSALARLSKTNTACAYAIWEACNLNRCPRYLHDIAQICHVSESSVLKLEKVLELNHTHCPATDYVERSLDCLDFPYWMHSIVKFILSHAHMLAQYKPLNVIAAIVVWISRHWPELKRRGREVSEESLLHNMTCVKDTHIQFNNENVTVQNVCKTLGTSSGVVYKIIRQLNDETLFEILNDAKHMLIFKEI